jgi:hypothetical protein
MKSHHEELEAAIDTAGRAEVFMRARMYGWGEGGAPEFVWWGIVREIQLERTKEKRDGDQSAALR